MLEFVRRLENQDDVTRREILLEELRARNWHYRLQNYVYAGQNGCNIIVDLNQADGSKLLLGAHYDSFFRSPGANDDASALAVLLDVGERLKSHNLNSHPVIVFFDDEEPTLHWHRPLGSTMYVKEFGVEALRAMITLELCGMGDAVAIWPVEGLEDRSVLKEMVRVLKEMKIPFEFGHRIPGFYADYLPFRETGFKDAYCLTAFSVRETLKLRRFAEGSPAGTFLRYLAWRFLRVPTVPKLFQHYHNKADRAEFLSEQTLQMMSDVVYRMILALTSEEFADRPV